MAVVSYLSVSDLLATNFECASTQLMQERFMFVAFCFGLPCQCVNPIYFQGYCEGGFIHCLLCCLADCSKILIIYIQANSISRVPFMLPSQVW